MTTTIMFYTALAATLMATLAVVLYNTALTKESTAHLDLVQEWKVVVQHSMGGSHEVYTVRVYPYGKSYKATYGDTTVSGTTPHLAVLRLACKLEWNLESVQYPYQTGIVEEVMVYCEDQCDSVQKEYGDLSDAGGGKGYTADECDLIGHGARLVKRRIREGSEPDGDRE